MSSTSPTFANVERPVKANRSDDPTLEDLFARMGITNEHARTTATSFIGRYEVFFAPEDDFCGLSDDGDSSFKFLEDELPDLVNSPTATTAVAEVFIVLH
ncbi:hypothetical protein K443DRAFT_14855 [Laccaria amethystina LaAM-08-1]|uniref:Uncharacterized protein n=1 Tax=Laccaria amethystina LaAM-08-1 TaxID=1095629 RepID=A0A0C9WHB3_9AGAR|nr:hypothetical protein K443DRAFT_14855 [Laccaria amethystina LaAM-08-1]